MEAAAGQPTNLPDETMAVLRQLADPSSGLSEACGYQPFPFERSDWIDRDAAGMDHLRNHRVPVLGGGTSPDGHARAESSGYEAAIGPSRLPQQRDRHRRGSRLFGAQASRFQPDDFRVASSYGVPEGSTLADWPSGCDDPAPFYRQFEQDLGVAPDGDYPMPATSPGRVSLVHRVADVTIARPVRKE